MSVTNEVLGLLEKNRGAFLSGQQIAESLSVSRNAVWKAVNRLKKDGYDIFSVTKKGYCLNEYSDVLEKEAIRRSLTHKDIKITVLDSVDSTNNEAKRQLAENENGILLICSDSQTAGRGRNGHSFFSPEKTGVYMTVAVHPKASISLAARATTATAVCVCLAVEELTGKKPLIKWVNDLYLDGKKICGILTEAISDFETRTAQTLIIGIGINISTRDFPCEIDGIAGALNPDFFDRNTLIANICDRVIGISENLDNPDFIDEYKKRCFVLGKTVNYERNGKAYTAKAVDIDENGALIVEKPDGKAEILQSGEISVKLK